MKRLYYLILFVSFPFINRAQEIIDFDSKQWRIQDGEITQYLGNKCLKGSAELMNLDFTNGIIEVDIAVNGERSYPGFFIRSQEGGNYEHFYIRPHRIWYNDAVQYAPAFNGTSCWQLYRGDGVNTGYKIPKNQWMHFKLEVKDTQARLFIDDMKEPVLQVNDLKHGISAGKIMLNAPANGSAYFANFSVVQTDNLDFPNILKSEEPYGMISKWKISQSLPLNGLDYEKTPKQNNLDITWTDVQADPSGLVNISKQYAKIGRGAECIYAKSNISSEKDEIRKFNFGYSDAIVIFLNGEPVYFGNSFYQSRDKSFLGIIGLHDAVYLPLKKGENELMIMLAEGFGGWGFMFMNAEATLLDNHLSESWQSEDSFSTSESVVYDSKRDVLYVSNFNQFTVGRAKNEEYISKLSTDGKLLKLKFIDSINNPLGMDIYNDKLYISERKNIVVYNLEKERIEKRISVPESLFLNDIAVDRKGNIYVSDSRKNTIWKYDGKHIEIWLEGNDILDPNALRIINNKLLVGNSGDQCLKSFDLKTKEMKVIAEFGPGFIDGIRQLPDGNLLVSHWDGRIYRVSAEGGVEKVLDVHNKGIYTADFEYVEEKGMLYIPTFYGNNVISYRTDF